MTAFRAGDLRAWRMFPVTCLEGDYLTHQSRLFLYLDGGIAEQGLDHGQTFMLGSGLSAIPAQLQGPQFIEIGNQHILPGKVVKKGRLGNLHPLAEALH